MHNQIGDGAHRARNLRDDEGEGEHKHNNHAEQRQQQAGRLQRGLPRAAVFGQQAQQKILEPFHRYAQNERHEQAAENRHQEGGAGFHHRPHTAKVVEQREQPDAERDVAKDAFCLFVHCGPPWAAFLFRSPAGRVIGSTCSWGRWFSSRATRMKSVSIQ